MLDRTRRWGLAGLALCTSIPFILAPTTANAGDEMCVTRMNTGGHAGVPGSIPGGKKPIWWDSTTAPLEFEDQRWVGASARTYHQTGPDTGFVRALWDDTDNSLYVWFRMDGGFPLEVESDPDPVPKGSPKDYVVVAVSPDGSEAQRTYVLVRPLASQCNNFASGTLCPTGADIAAADVQFMRWDGATYQFVDAATASAAGIVVEHPWVQATMSDLGDSTTCSGTSCIPDPANPGSSIPNPTQCPRLSEYRWDVKMKIQMPPPAAGANAFFDTLMTINNFCSFGTDNPLFIEQPYPRSNGPGVNGFGAALDNSDPPNDVVIKDAILQAGLGGYSIGAPCTDGIRVADRFNDLGTDYDGTDTVPPGLVGNRIRPGDGTITQFRVLPTNDDTLAVGPGQLGATFYLANWGVSPSVGSAWEKLNSTPATNTSSIAAGAKGAVTFDWPLTTGFDGGTHQCVQVQLESVDGNLDIASQGAWRNLDIASTSVFTDTAQVSTRGLPANEGPYRVWLILDPDNLPTPQTCEKSNKQAPGCDNGQGKRFTLLGRDEAKQAESARKKEYEKFLARASQLKGKKLAKFLETEGAKLKSDGVHGSQISPASFDGGAEGAVSPAELPQLGINAYIERRGDTLNIDGEGHSHLEPLGGFGYYVEHEGDLQGWEYELLGNPGELVKVGERMYFLDLEADQVATIAPVIRAIDSTTKTCAADADGAGCALDEPLPKVQTFAPSGPITCPEGQVPKGDECVPPDPCPPNHVRNKEGVCVLEQQTCKDRGCCCDVEPGDEHKLPLAFGALALCFGAGAVLRRRRRRKH